MGKNYARKHYDNILAVLSTEIGKDQYFVAFDISRKLLKRNQGVSIDTVRLVLNDLIDEGILRNPSFNRKNQKEFVKATKKGHAKRLENPIVDVEEDVEEDFSAMEEPGLETRPEGVVIEGVDLDTVFVDDHRDNTNLHNLYVGYAMVDLEIIDSTIKQLSAQSRWPATLVANDLIHRRKQLIMTNAAYLYAAAMLTAGFTPEEFQRHHGNYDADLDTNDMI